MVSYEQVLKLMKAEGKGLNPYCSGRWSRTEVVRSDNGEHMCLNPYCSGRWSRTACNGAPIDIAPSVLILIVVEDGLVRRTLMLLSASKGS